MLVRAEAAGAGDLHIEVRAQRPVMRSHPSRPTTPEFHGFVICSREQSLTPLARANLEVLISIKRRV
jgi:hypothetical protein